MRYRVYYWNLFLDCWLEREQEWDTFDEALTEAKRLRREGWSAVVRRTNEPMPDGPP